MKHWKQFDLQLFAGEGAAGGADGGAAGAGGSAEAASAGSRATASPQPGGEEKGQAAAVPKEKPDWDTLMADPEYNRRMQQIVRGRLKDARQAQSAMEMLSPGLKAFAQRSGLRGDDYAGLAKALTGEETAASRQRAEARIEAHFRGMREQAEKLKEIFPGFDLAKELQDPAFARMTHPRVGLSVEDAYYVRHRDQIQGAAMEAAARITAEKLSRSIQAGAGRPQEAGAGSPSLTAFDYRSAPKAQRDALKHRIYQSRAKGEKIYPGGGI